MLRTVTVTFNFGRRHWSVLSFVSTISQDLYAQQAILASIQAGTAVIRGNARGFRELRSFLRGEMFETPSTSGPGTAGQGSCEGKAEGQRSMQRTRSLGSHARGFQRGAAREGGVQTTANPISCWVQSVAHGDC